MRVDRGVYLQDEAREVDEEAASLVVPEEATSALLHVGAKAVQGLAKGWDVEHVPNEDVVPIQRDDRRALAEHRGVRIAGHSDALVRPVIRHKCLTIGDHVLCGAGVGNG